MKKITFKFRKWAFLTAFLLACSFINAQKSTRDYPLGTNVEFLNQLQSKLKTTGNEKPNLMLYVSNKEALQSMVNYQHSKDDILHLEGEVQGNTPGTFRIIINKNQLEGNIIFPQNKKAYSYYSDTKGNAFIKEMDINKIVCVDFHVPTTASLVEKSQKSTPNVSISNLQSFPGAAGCLLLDFDGHTVPSGSGWNGGNPIVALPSGMSDANILEAWEIVAEDFRPFNLNVTTDENVYNSYPQNKRRRCVITPTDIVSPGGAGTALINSFSSLSDLPCWVFTLSSGIYGKIVGEIASHEFGHTFGLYHDGQGQYAYYSGNGNWAPIMGVSYYKNVTQWSKAEYSNGSNHEDDLAIISNPSTNGVGYRQDNQGDTFSTASYLTTSGELVEASQNKGIIDHTNDVDMFLFHANGGTITLKVQASERHSDLLLKVQLYNSQHVLISSYTGNPMNLGDPVVITTTLAAGDYYLAISGTGEGTPDTGYTNYASLGLYSISGNIPKIGFLGVNEIENVSVYPRVVKNEFTIDPKKGNYEVQILNSLGQLLYKKMIANQTHQVPFSDKPIGMYFVIVRNAKTGYQKSFSIIKH
ncbi:hypothetical protein ATE47_03750 [Chryseobacterium sp. IHB B 17019]|uniref:T9SS type A sorting domain-containing protein n=1 Tax=Chryseobacterium sp. IHB B 17019 TaxID=1721091 RepID=UPI000720E598|nr:T9SS type A sorting domain-containing protein [Chryseobacterium sp. IHB B 17019]ALR29691.1 hypothetical protein ATE47_03750 [Chryseobacterium sp. IHB B 17019]